MTGIVDIITGVEVVACLIGLTVFAGSYAWFFNWRLTPAGTALMYFVLSLISLVIVSALRLIFGVDHPAFWTTRTIVFTALTFTTWRLVWVLWHTPPLTQYAESSYRKPRSHK